jgi:hypothetical protein
MHAGLRQRQLPGVTVVGGVLEAHVGAGVDQQLGTDARAGCVARRERDDGG